MLPEFESFSKIPRFRRDILITEKIDGTNAVIWVDPDEGTVTAGSRSRWLVNGAKNFGFEAWVKDNEEMLRRLGPGRHYGEWWGQGIQRGYGLKEKRFSLFNVARCRKNPPPECCGVVPVLYEGPFVNFAIDTAMASLQVAGSVAAPGFMHPEGIVIFHTAASKLFKITMPDDGPKDNEQGGKVRA
jgi:RNA ligase